MDIFELSLPKGDNQAQKLEDGEIPLISSGSTNNGIVKLINQGEPNSELYSKDKITVDMFGQAFYHNYDFYAVSHGRVNILTPKHEDFSESVANFIISIFNATFPSRYGFSTMCSQKRLQQETIKLPARKNQQGEFEPDWKYMEDYMQNIELRAKNRIESIQRQVQIHKTA